VADTGQAERISREVFVASFLGDTRAVGWASQRMAARMTDMFLSAGDVLYRVGEPADHHYFVVKGEMRLTKPTGSAWVLGERSLIGTLDAILERPRSRDAVATMPTHLLKLRSEDWLEFLEDSFVMARRALMRVSAQVDELRRRPPPLGGFDPPPPPAPAAEAPLHLVNRILLLRDVPIFSRASIQTLATLAELSTVLHAAKGEVLFERGAMKDKLVVVASGEVEASRSAPELVARFGRGGLVCGPGAFGDGAAYEVRATASTRALSVSLEDFVDVMEEHFGLTRSAMMAMAEEREMLLDRGVPPV
jgi:CRP-like cAMP-binding protein